MLTNINQAIIWAAGFLEGDGCFILRKGRYIAVQAGQINPEPIADLVRWFNGTVSHSNGIYLWRLSRHNAAALMMTLYSFMSEKRKEQIRKCLRVWKKVEHRRQDENCCVKGHQLCGANLLWNTANGVKYKICSQCERESRRKRYVRDKAMGVV